MQFQSNRIGFCNPIHCKSRQPSAESPYWNRIPVTRSESNDQIQLTIETRSTRFYEDPIHSFQRADCFIINRVIDDHASKTALSILIKNQLY